jgi:hypothetical protein
VLCMPIAGNDTLLQCALLLALVTFSISEFAILAKMVLPTTWITRFHLPWWCRRFGMLRLFGVTWKFAFFKTHREHFSDPNFSYQKNFLTLRKNFVSKYKIIHNCNKYIYIFFNYCIWCLRCSYEI